MADDPFIEENGADAEALELGASLSATAVAWAAETASLASTLEVDASLPPQPARVVATSNAARAALSLKVPGKLLIVE